MPGIRNKWLTLAAAVIVFGLAVFYVTQRRPPRPAAGVPMETGEVNKKQNKNQRQRDEWKDKLSPLQYHVTQMKGTERAFTGEYWDNEREGLYACVCCQAPLFDSSTKYKSGTGWPSFWSPFNRQNVATAPDYSGFTVRTEVLCSQCGAHLGHVFKDGPEPTGLRYCINSAALNFQQSVVESQADVGDDDGS